MKTNLIKSNRVSCSKRVALFAVVTLVLIYFGIGFYFSQVIPHKGFETFSECLRLGDFGDGRSSDGETMWIGNAHAIKGENPLPFLMNEKEPEHGIKKAIENNNPYLPWTYITSNVFFPGFISLLPALWWCMIVSLMLIVLMAVKIRQTVFTESKNIFLSTLVMLLCLAQYGFCPSLKFINASLFVTPLIILGVLYNGKKNEIITGLLLGLAMLKPQTAALFFIPLLFQKKWKSIITGVLCVLVPWFCAALVYEINFVQLFLDHQAANLKISELYNQLNPNTLYWGFLDYFIQTEIISSNIGTMVQVIIFTAVTAILSYKYRNASNAVLFSIPAVFSTCWMYCVSTNLPVLALLIMAIVLLLFREKRLPLITKILLMAGIVFLIMPIPELIRKIYSPIFLPLLQRSIYIVLLAIVLKYEKIKNVTIENKIK
ncbi:MAG: DUF2029 domain-containing protein [Bacteroidales bacterium]|jgi:hypothetical protein|nr:DUF2029 domain-containing protein [Bacteroidales bacterium]